MTTEDYYDKYWTEGVAGWAVEAGLTEHMREFLIGVASGRDVLDYGGGDGERYGAVVREVARTLTVADVSPAVLEKRRSEGDGAVHVDDLASHTGNYDVALYLEVLEHLLDPLSALRLGAATLRDGGQVVISVPNAFSWLNRARMVAGRLPASGVGGRGVRGCNYIAPHIRFFDVASLTHLVEAADLRVTSVQTDMLDAWRLANHIQINRLKPISGRFSRLMAATLIVTAERR